MPVLERRKDERETFPEISINNTHRFHPLNSNTGLIYLIFIVLIFGVVTILLLPDLIFLLGLFVVFILIVSITIFWLRRESRPGNATKR